MLLYLYDFMVYKLSVVNTLFSMRGNDVVFLRNLTF